MGNVNMEARQIHYRGGNKPMSVEEAIKDATELTPEQKTNINKIPTIEAAVATKAAQSIIAPEFDSESGVYAIGDLVMHEGKLYEFTTAHETAGEWDSTEVTEKTVADEVNSVKSGLTNVQNRRHVYNISTADAELNTSYTVDLPSGYNRANTIITGINLYKYSTLYSEMTITKDNDLDCAVTINSSDKLSYILRGSTTVGANTYLRVMIERID